MDIIDIVDRVELFYENAWQKLIITGSIVIGVIGIIVPIAIQIYQNKVLKHNESRLRAEILKENEERNAKLTQILSEELQHNFSELEKKLDKKTKLLKGMGAHIQGNAALENKYFLGAASNFLDAFYLYSFDNDTRNMHIVFGIIERNKTNLLTKTILTEYAENSRIKFDELFDTSVKNVSDMHTIYKLNELKKTIQTLLTSTES